MECRVEHLFRLPTTRILAWNICWLALLPENQLGSLPASRLPVLIRVMPHWITSESPTIRVEQLRENIRKPTELIRRP
jgi:hypothetical protein